MSRALVRGCQLARGTGSLCSPAHEGRRLISGLEWFLGTTLAVLYLFILFTAGMLTFRKGHLVLFFRGIVLPFLWLVGAVLPDRNEGMTTGRMTPST